MGWRDSLRKSVGSAIVAGANLAEQGFKSIQSARQEAADARRWEKIDEQMSKAARESLSQDQGKNTKGDSTEAEHIVGDPIRDPKAIAYDPFDVVSAMGYRDRPSSLSYGAQEAIGRSVPVLADIVKTRVNQVSLFCQTPDKKHGTGFKVRHRDYATQPSSSITQKRCQELEKLILHTGYHDPSKPHEATSLLDFAKCFIPDSLIHDQACVEIVPDGKGRPSYMSIVDPTTIRLLDPAYRAYGDPFAVQVIDGVVVADFTRDELAFCVRNPRSGIRSYGYGCSEIETLVREITGLLWGMEYNRKFFCIAGHETVETKHGLIPISELVGDKFEIWNGYDWRHATAYETGHKPVVRTKLWNGLVLRTSQKHLFRCIPQGSETGDPEWVQQCDLKPGDVLLVNNTVSDPETIDADSLHVGSTYEVDRCTARPWTPTRAVVADPEFWEMIGFALGDGYWPSGSEKMGIYPHHTKDIDLFDRFMAVCERHGINARRVTINKHVIRQSDGDQGYPAIHIHHVAFVRWLRDLGFASSDKDRRIPMVLYRQPAYIRCALLRGLFSADGHRHQHVSGYTTPQVHSSCEAFRENIMTCLWSVGVAANEVGSGWGRHGTILAHDVRSFVAQIGFLQAYKNKDLGRTDKSAGRWDCLHPSVSRKVAMKIQDSDRWLTLSIKDRCMIGKVTSGANNMSRQTALRLCAAVDIPILEALRYCHVAVDVCDAEPFATIPMFDVEVFDQEHVFLANHIAVHNSQGSATKGILNFKGTISEKHLSAFRRMWYSQLASVANAWRTPIVNSDDLQWINMQMSNRDMEYGAWIDFLIKICCSRYNIAPEEVNFSYGNTGQSQAMGQAPIEEKLNASQDLGLNPLVKFFFSQINIYFLQRIDPDFEAIPVGLEREGEQKETDILEKKTRVYMTVNEAREQAEKPPLTEEQGGNVILNPVWLQYVQQSRAATSIEGQIGNEEPTSKSLAVDRAEKNELHFSANEAKDRVGYMIEL